MRKPLKVQISQYHDLRITEEGDVDVVGDGDEPQRVPEQRGDEPVLADQDVVEEQLHEVEDHQEREKGAKIEIELKTWAKNLAYNNGTKWKMTKNLASFKTKVTFGHDLIYVQESSRSFWLYRPNLRDIIRGVRESVCVWESVWERERERESI